MRFGINTLDDFDVGGRTVLLRIDINQPVDKEKGILKSISRIKATVPTIKELSKKGAKVVLLAHQGSDIEYNNFYTTKPHAQVLSELLGKTVKFIEDVCSPYARDCIAALHNGEIILLDNIRFCSEEQTLFEMKLNLSPEQQVQTEIVKKLAPLADLYVCDAFAAAHRNQPSLCAFERVLPSAMGRLFEAEYCAISELMHNPQRPCVFVLGGAKVSDAFLMMETVLCQGTADRILTGGLVANIMLIAAGLEVGRGSRDFIKKSNYDDQIPIAKRIYDRYVDRIILPQNLAFLEDGRRQESTVDHFPAHGTALDIGTDTALVYAEIIRTAGCVFVNGPMGVFEELAFENGSRIVWNALGDTNAFTVIGGGDSITATTKFSQTDNISYICTGGGALIRFLSGEELPVVRALRQSAQQTVKA